MMLKKKGLTTIQVMMGLLMALFLIAMLIYLYQTYGLNPIIRAYSCESTHHGRCVPSAQGCHVSEIKTSYECPKGEVCCKGSNPYQEGEFGDERPGYGESKIEVQFRIGSNTEFETVYDGSEITLTVGQTATFKIDASDVTNAEGKCHIIITDVQDRKLEEYKKDCFENPFPFNFNPTEGQVGFSLSILVSTYTSDEEAKRVPMGDYVADDFFVRLNIESNPTD